MSEEEGEEFVLTPQACKELSDACYKRKRDLEDEELQKRVDAFFATFRSYARQACYNGEYQTTVFLDRDSSKDLKKEITTRLDNIPFKHIWRINNGSYSVTISWGSPPKK